MKVAIVGGAPSRPPYHNQSVEIWALGRYADFPRVTRIFELHGREVWSHWRDKMIKANVPIYVKAGDVENLPNTVDVQYDRIRDEFGYATCSISIMLAWCIYLGATSVELHGVPLSGQVEYTKQRPSVLYYIGLLRGRGINFADESNLVKWESMYV